MAAGWERERFIRRGHFTFTQTSPFENRRFILIADYASQNSVDWADLGDLLDAGWNVGGAFAHLHRGEDMAAIRTMAALAR